MNDLAVGSKSDAGITRFGNYIFFVTELGGANFLGGISAYELPSAGSAVPMLTIEVVGNSLQLSWPESASDFVLEQSASLTGDWLVIAGPGATSVSVPMTNSGGFFRLRR